EYKMNIITSLRSALWKTGTIKLLQKEPLFRNDVQRSFSGIIKAFNIINIGCNLMRNEGLNLLSPQIPILSQACGFKVKGKPQRRCKDCYYVVRERRLFVICDTHPRHKQMAMKKPDKARWTIAHACQSKVRPW
ncbi:hypothetical protein L9F63_007226, partial [Diploptera punctata]